MIRLYDSTINKKLNQEKSYVIEKILKKQGFEVNYKTVNHRYSKEEWSLTYVYNDIDINYNSEKLARKLKHLQKLFTSLDIKIDFFAVDKYLIFMTIL